MPEEVLGPEAPIAQCDMCDEVRPLPLGVICQGCGNFFCRLKGHRSCWGMHWCGMLTTRYGEVVRIGDLLEYEDNHRTYLVVETPKTFVNHGVGLGSLDGYQPPFIIRPRLMKHVEVEKK